MVGFRDFFHGIDKPAPQKVVTVFEFTSSSEIDEEPKRHHSLYIHKSSPTAGEPSLGTSPGSWLTSRPPSPGSMSSWSASRPSLLHFPLLCGWHALLHELCALLALSCVAPAFECGVYEELVSFDNLLPVVCPWIDSL